MDDTLATPHTQSRRASYWGLGAAILGLALLLLIAGLGWRGYQDGRAIREQREREAAALFVARADALMGAGELELAEQDLVAALRLAPDYPAAEERLGDVHRQLAEAGITTTLPEGVHLPPAAAGPSPFDILNDARRAVSVGAWGDALDLLSKLRKLDPAFEKDAVSALVAQAAMTDALQQIDSGDIQTAIQRFETVLAETPDNAEAAEQLDLARQYADAISRWDKDWSYTTARLDALFERVPNYRDVTTRLTEAYVVQGDLLMDQGRPCQAEDVFARAAIIGDMAEIRSRQAAARQACQTGPAAVRQPPTLAPRVVETRDTPDSPPQIIGQIADREGKPLGGFVVTAIGRNASRQTLSDPSGVFTFPDIPAGVYSLDVPEGVGSALGITAAPGRLVVVEFRGR